MALGFWALSWILILRPELSGERLTNGLDDVVTSFSSGILNLLQRYHWMDGQALTFATHRFSVSDLCSGWISIIGMLSVATAIAIWKRRTRVMHLILLLVGGVFWAIYLKVLAVGIMVLSKYKLNIDIQIEWPWFGCAAYLAGCCALVSWDSFLAYVLEPISLSWQRRRRTPLVAIWNQVMRWTILKPVQSETEKS